MLNHNTVNSIKVKLK